MTRISGIYSEHRMFRFKYFLMRCCIKGSAGLRRLADLLHSLPVAFFRPEELLEICRRYYGKAHVIDGWDRNREGGLEESEKEFIERYGFKQAKVLVVGCGAGRETIVLARAGFDVTAVDISPEMVARAAANCSDAKVPAVPKLVSFFGLETLRKSYDFILCGTCCGYIPTEPLRKKFLSSVCRVLRPGGRAMWTFVCYEPGRWDSFRLGFYKALAFIAFGNTRVQRGDRIFGDGEFHHCYASADEAIAEAVAAGFVVDRLSQEKDALFLKKGETTC
jgi:SAM-dependent methyltransferase